MDITMVVLRLIHIFAQGRGLKAWSEADFVRAARTRVSEFMPWKGLNRMTDDELKAIWLYLKSLPMATTERERR